MRVFLRLLIGLDYSFLEEIAVHFANGDENTQQSDEEIVLAVLDGTVDEKLIGLALRIVLSDHVSIPHESQPDLLTEAEQVFASKKLKTAKAKTKASGNKKVAPVGPSPKKEVARKKAASGPFYSGAGFVRAFLSLMSLLPLRRSSQSCG